MQFLHKPAKVAVNTVYGFLFADLRKILQAPVLIFALHFFL